MPDVDGLTLLAEIHGCYPEMPIFILTAYATLESAIEAVRRGARDYMLKPIEPETLITRVRDVLAGQSLPHRRREIASQLQMLLDGLHSLDNDVPAPGNPAPESVAEPSRFLQRGLLTLDLHTHRVLLKERQIPLPPSTFAYLVTLMRHSPNPVSYEILGKEAQGYQVLRTEACEITRGQIHELRKAVEEDMRNPQYIITVRDFGYRLVT
jgi:DNA-binding response OmpR family regulator